MFKILIPIVAIANGFPGSQFGNLRSVGKQRNKAISNLIARNPAMSDHHSIKSSNNVKWSAQLFDKACILKRTPRGRKRLVCADPDDEKEMFMVQAIMMMMHYLE